MNSFYERKCLCLHLYSNISSHRNWSSLSQNRRYNYKIEVKFYWFRLEVLELVAIVVDHARVPIICQKRSIPVASSFYVPATVADQFFWLLIIWTLLRHCHGLRRGLLYNSDWTFILHHRLLYFQDKICMFHSANTAIVNDRTSYISCGRVIVFPSAVWLPSLMVTWLSERQRKQPLTVCSIKIAIFFLKLHSCYVGHFCNDLFHLSFFSPFAIGIAHQTAHQRPWNKSLTKSPIKWYHALLQVWKKSVFKSISAAGKVNCNQIIFCKFIFSETFVVLSIKKKRKKGHLPPLLSL